MDNSSLSQSHPHRHYFFQAKPCVRHKYFPSKEGDCTLVVDCKSQQAVIVHAPGQLVVTRWETASSQVLPTIPTPPFPTSYFPEQPSIAPVEFIASKPSSGSSSSRTCLRCGLRRLDKVTPIGTTSSRQSHASGISISPAKKVSVHL